MRSSGGFTAINIIWRNGVGTGRPRMPVTAAPAAEELQEEYRPAGEVPVIRSSLAAPQLFETPPTCSQNPY
ncbi:hypothetical protein INR49_003740 [Caranx melampygus]|nr:hypothetical protein INR49_003740 [Caranx melampygus]